MTKFVLAALLIISCFGCARSEYPNAVLIEEGNLDAGITRLSGNATGHAVFTRGSMRGIVVNYQTDKFTVTINGCEVSH